ncbi:MAG TPA: M20/M25/M40 family metallo-hydrolase [Usitatibacter sp.]|nr:M20/M25/M40 family metallo-hydrolase [Usitatibacter sp.]
MSALHAAIERGLAVRQADAVAFLAELVKVPSDTPPGDNTPHADRAAALLGALGMEAERHEVPAALVAGAGMRSITNLVVRHRFGPGPTVALNAHGDVVPPGDGWTRAPYGAEVQRGRMYGRGVAVSKSDFATYAFALAALREHGSALRGAVELHFTYDEELGGELGPRWLLENGLARPDFAICAGFSYAIVTAHNGSLQMEVTMTGKAAHAAIPKSGIDALRAATAMLQDLYKDAESLQQISSRTPGIDHPTLNVGRIEGGLHTNVVPETVKFRLDRRMVPEEDPALVESHLRQLLETSAKRHAGIRLEIRRLLLAQALRPTHGQAKLVEALQRHGQRVFGEAISVHGVPLYTDARHYAAAGIPVVLYGAGPRTIEESNAKRADENVSLDDLHRATRVVACAVADLLS